MMPTEGPQYWRRRGGRGGQGEGRDAKTCGAEAGPATPSSTHRARKRTVPGKKKLCKPVLVYQG